MMPSPMILLLLALLLLASSMSTVDAATPHRARGVRGIHNRRRLHPDTTSKATMMGNSIDAGARAGLGGFFTGYENPSHGMEGHIHGYKKAKSIHTDVAARGSTTTPFVSSSMGVSSQTSQLGFADKCAAAQAGDEFHTSSFVPVYYQYEVLTSSNRDVLQVVDIVDKAFQHFLAVWLVDCDGSDTTLTTTAPTIATTSAPKGSTRRLWQNTNINSGGHRKLQATLAPIVGTGVGEWDIVLLGGTAVDECTSELGALATTSVGLVCYKVVGSTFIYLDESITVDPNEIETLTLETLTVGVNMVEPDTFTELDPDIYRLHLISGYDEKPEALIATNRGANQRQWDDGLATASALSEPGEPTGEERSGGAKFGIAFAILCCLSLVVFLSVYLWKNRGLRFVEEFHASGKQHKHHNMDDETDASTLPTTRYDRAKGRADPDDQVTHQEINVAFRAFVPSGSGRIDRKRGGSPESTGTHPLSPETPRHQFVKNDDITQEESNIVSPCSDSWGCRDFRSTVSDETNVPFDVPVNVNKASPDDRGRIHVKLACKKKLREVALRHQKPSQLVSPSRSYDFTDTVDL